MGKGDLNRRHFAKKIALAGFGTAMLPVAGKANSFIAPAQGASLPNLKISLNAYSFDKPLRAGAMTLEKLLEYCSEKGFDGVDLTGYYFPGYPAVPSDDFIYNIKRRAARLGLGISGTGVKNDFTWSDPAKRAGEKQLVKNWTIVAEKLGAPVLRIFTGTLSREAHSWDERAKWIADDIIECSEFGRQHGVMMGLQNHYDFLKTSEDVEKIMSMVGSDWTGLLLDIGSYHSPDPYRVIAINSKHAISWQLKEKVYVNDTQVDTDYHKVIDIVRNCGYKGYLPIETLGEGNPTLKVEALLNKVRAVLDK